MTTVLAPLLIAGALLGQQRAPSADERALPDPLPPPIQAPGPEVEIEVERERRGPSSTARSSPDVSFRLLGRDACVFPIVQKDARADGGFIDVRITKQGRLKARLTGTTAAHTCLGFTSSATETFLLSQVFELTSGASEPLLAEVTLESALIGYAFSEDRAGASAQVAEVAVLPVDGGATPLALAHEPLGVAGTAARSCNQLLPPVRAWLPVPGRYVLTAKLVLNSSAGGCRDGHAVADFSPDTQLPGGWLRPDDPFQGVAKQDFGMTITLSASSAPGSGGGTTSGALPAAAMSPQPAAPAIDAAAP